jgi:RNA polymerase sigma factor FliA
MMSLETAATAKRRTPRSQTQDASEEASAQQLWSRYWGDTTQPLRNELLLHYKYLTAQAVSRLPSSIRTHWDTDDLESIATLGLVEAIERFEENSVVERFPSYAASRIRGAVFDELRRLDWLPRTVRRRVITYRSTAETLSAELGRTPESTEILHEMGADSTASHKILTEVQSAQLARLDEPAGGGRGETISVADTVASRTIAPDESLIAAEELDELRAAVAALPERQRTVISLHLLGGLTQEQIGAMLGVTNSRICQIEAAALQTLRKVLGRQLL